MPLHMSPLMSRRALLHPEEKPPVKPAFETVLKFNPNHGPDGKFSSGGGGGKIPPRYSGGQLTGPKPSGIGHGVARSTPSLGYGGPSTGIDYGVYTPNSPRSEVQYLKSHMHGTSDKGYGPGGGAGKMGRTFDPNDTNTHPVGTVYDSDGTFHVPTGETVDAATQDKYKGGTKTHPVGTSYDSGGATNIPYKGGYFDLGSGKVYRSYHPDRAAEQARDAAKGAAYVAAYGKGSAFAKALSGDKFNRAVSNLRKARHARAVR